MEAGPAQIQIRDVWEGPDEYAEDYYSGGDVRLREGQPAIPDLLEPEPINLDADDLEENPVSCLPLSEVQGMSEDGSSLGSPSVDVSPEAHVVSQDLQNGHTSSEGLKAFNKEVLGDRMQRSSDEVAGLTFDMLSDAQETAALSPELQNVLASPPRRTLSDLETIDGDFDLEYPDNSRSTSVTRDIASVEGDAFPANSLALESELETLVDRGSLLQTTRPTSGDAIQVDGAENITPDIVVHDGKGIGQGGSVEVSELSPAHEEGTSSLLSLLCYHLSTSDSGSPYGRRQCRCCHYQRTGEGR